MRGYQLGMTVPLFSVRCLALAAAVAGASACAATPPPENASAQGVAATAAAREALYRARLDSARARFTPADVRFMNNMIAHHSQAVVMAKLAPTNGASQTIRVLAARILNAQTDEIAIMKRWLGARDQPVPSADTALPGKNSQSAAHADALADAHAGHAMMPGMLTDAQLAQLAAARGVAFDRLFLTLMIAHHKGAVVMVEELFATDGAGQDTDVFRFASDVQVDQRTEVARMELMLEALASSSGF